MRTNHGKSIGYVAAAAFGVAVLISPMAVGNPPMLPELPGSIIGSDILPPVEREEASCISQSPEFGTGSGGGSGSGSAASAGASANPNDFDDSTGGVWTDNKDFDGETDVTTHWTQSSSGNANTAFHEPQSETQGTGSARAINFVTLYAWDDDQRGYTPIKHGNRLMAFAHNPPDSDSGSGPGEWYTEPWTPTPGVDYLGLWGVYASVVAGNNVSGSSSAELTAGELSYCWTQSLDLGE